MSFTHLHVHSHYSPLQAACTIPGLVSKCLEYDMDSVALTDYGNMFGVLEFYFACKNKNINPIIGCEVYYVDDHQNKEKYSGASFRDPTKGSKTLVLLAQNQEGYKNLCHINTTSYQDGFYFLPRVDYNILEKYKAGLIAFTGGQRGRVPNIYYRKGKDKALEEIKTLKKIFGKNFYLEFQGRGINNCMDYNAFLVEVSKKENIDLLAGNDVHYIEKKEHIIQDVLFCIGTNRTLSDRERTKLGPSEFYFKDSETMKSMFDDTEFSTIYKEACERTTEISKQCSVNFKVKDEQGNPIYHLPKGQKEEGEKSLKVLAEQGLEERFKEAELRQEALSNEKKDEYKKRLKYELQIISDMGFTGYFYIVQDFIHWAKSHQVPVGPGRGSGASSLASYSLRITDLDPMPLNLIFERFLNPARISMPDFDIDFCQENRHRVIDYINEKYGTDCTSHVITYGKLNVRAAIRDVGRVLGMSYGEVDRLAKMIPNILGINVKETLEKEPRFKILAEEDPQIGELIELTKMIEGLIRNVGIHAAGIIIADTPIVEYAPLYKGSEGENVIQYDLKHSEKIGLVKFDFLGLKTLTHIQSTIDLIKETQNKKIIIQNISLKDQGIYKVMCQGDTAGVFQFEGFGITDLLIKAQPTCFEDIVAINALYRPGPMSMIPSYLERKKGKVPVRYIFPKLQPILKETYGIIVYQEQVQQIAVEIAGYSYAEADVLRRAMGKKIISEMQEQKVKFLEGAKNKDYPSKQSEDLFDLMAEFAKYGFNKSHAAAYCVLAAQTAWLKCYYPLEFFACQLTIDQNDSDKINVYIQDVKKHKVEVVSPHVNTSNSVFSIKDKKIQYSLGAIKGVGSIAAENIQETRDRLPDKKFKSLEHFFETINVKKVNKKSLDSLIKAGALDGFGYDRKVINANVEKFIKHSVKLQEDVMSGQQSLFGGEDLKDQTQVKIESKEVWTDNEKMFYEKEIFGFYLNRHPMDLLQGFSKHLSYKKISEVLHTAGHDSIQVLGLVQNLKEVLTKKKEKMMAFAQIDDGTGYLEAIFFSKLYEKEKLNLIMDGRILLFRGNLQKDERGNSSRFLIEEILSLDDFLKQVKEIKIKLQPDMKTQDLNHLKELLISSKEGDSKLRLESYIPDKQAFVKIESSILPKEITIDRNFLERVQGIINIQKRVELR